MKIGICLGFRYYNFEFHKFMPKLKTRKSVIKRVKITAKKKVMRRDIGQGHFNSRNPGKITRRKRSDEVVFKTDAENILRNLPYN